MEFPGLGKHCNNQACKRLDFLPMKCDACSQTFCNDHIHYSTHSCPDSYKKDNQVPVCPLCNKPIPLKKGEVPDVVVGRHIDSDCQSDPAKERRKVYTNRCSMKGCKVKEMIPVTCEKCHKNFCLRHRFEDDHSCQGYEGSGQGMSNSGAAALKRIQGQSSSNQSKPQPTRSQAQSDNRAKPSQANSRSSNTSLLSDLHRERQQRQQQQQQQSQARVAQAGLSNEEALARAIQQSLAESQQTGSNQPQQMTQEEEDILLAQALAASEEEARREALRRRQQSSAQQQSEDKRSCNVC